MAATGLRSLFEAAVACRDLAAGRPLELSGAPSTWLLLSGRAEVFLVPGGLETPSGPRRHLFTAAEGDLLLGMDPESCVVAVGSWGTRVSELPAADLAESPSGPSAAEIAAALDRWITSLGSALAPGPPPRVFKGAVAGEDLRLEKAGGAVRPAGGVVWVGCSQGEASLFGLSGGPDLASQQWPLSPSGWIAAPGGAILRATSTEEFVRDGSIWRRLASYHRNCGLLLARLEEEQRLENLARFKSRTQLDRETLARACENLSAVLDPEIARGPSIAGARDPLLAACLLVGGAQGIALIAPGPGAPLRGDRLEAIARASRVRARKVALRGEWWKKESGPLLGYRVPDPSRPDRIPVALLPAERLGYDMVDPSDGSRVRVDAEVAASLDAFATMFFSPLPERPLKGSDLWRLGLFGSGRDFLVLGLVGAAGGLLALLTPIVTGYLFGTVIPDADYGPLGQVTLGLVIAALSSAFFELTRSICALRAGARMESSLQAAVWDRLLSLPASFFRNYTVGDLATRALGIHIIRQTFAGATLSTILASVFSIFNLVLLFHYSWKLGLVALVLLVFLALIVLLGTRAQLRFQRRIQDLQGKISGLVLQLLTAVSKLRVAAGERRALQVWSVQFARQRALSVTARRISNWLTAFSSSYPVLCSLWIFFMTTWVYEEASLSTGDFMAFNSAFGQFLGASLTLLSMLPSFIMIAPVYQRMRPILSAVPEVDPEKADPGDLAGDLEVSHVTFRYHEGSPHVLQDVSLRVRPGEFVALVGPSGSGKSTLLRLILGFDQPERGSVLFDGQDLSGLDVQAVRRQIGAVLQNGRLMTGDIFSNIVGSSNLTMDDAWEAARMAGLEEDIRAMPMGMQTVVSEGAATFSGGQRQRLMIARAIVHRPRIILFDEATSALDNRTQAIVSRSLQGLRATRVAIAHRLSTIQRADRIFVLDRGLLVESGTFESLMAQGGLFAELARRQLA